MSPLVERPRDRALQRDAPTDQHWSILAFESFSAGAMAVFAGLAAVLLVVSVYAVIVWPLTFMDLADSGLEKYSDLAKLVLWSVFFGGSLAGYWCFSGEAFKKKPKPKPNPAMRNRRAARR